MQKLRITTWASCALIAIAAVAIAGPGPWRGSRGWANDGAYGRLFDPAKIVTVSGEIAGFAKFTPMRGMGAGIHLKLKSQQELLDVHLGPAWYVEAQDTTLKVGDKVDVRGSRIEIAKKPAIIAIEVRRGEDTLSLRDNDGFPRWAGWRRRGAPPAR